MTTADLYLRIVLSLIFISGICNSCLRTVTCPCGSGRRTVYYTHCINGSSEEFACKRWANCKTCEENKTYCLSCHPNHSGPTCIEENIEKGSCPDPGIPKGGNRVSVNETEDTYPRSFLKGESVHFSCNEEDSTLQGPSVITCTSSGEWSGLLPWCEKPGKETPLEEKYCRYPGIDANGVIEDPPLQNSFGEEQVFRSGTRLIFKCREGYRLEGQKALFCLCSGEWTSDPPICVPEASALGSHPLVHCGGRGPILNGHVVEFHDLERRYSSYEDSGYLYPVGSQLQYECHDGYTLRGARIVVCESTGQWSAEEPTCIEYTDLNKGALDNEVNLRALYRVGNHLYLN